MPPRSSDASVLGRACSSRKSEKVSGTKIFWKIKKFGPAPCRATFPSSSLTSPATESESSEDDCEVCGGAVRCRSQAASTSGDALRTRLCQKSCPLGLYLLRQIDRATDADVVEMRIEEAVGCAATAIA